jgi:hypothetical protein
MILTIGDLTVLSMYPRHNLPHNDPSFPTNSQIRTSVRAGNSGLPLRGILDIGFRIAS